MSENVNRLPDYLRHIIEAIDRIDRYTGDMDEVSFLENELVQDAVIRNLEVIGEASRNVERRYPEFEKEYPDLPLAIAYEMRNALAHGYFKVDVSVVWRTIENDLPTFQEQVAAVLAQLQS